MSQNPNGAVDLGYGQAPTDAASQLTWAVLYDTIVYLPGTTGGLQAQNVFDGSTNRPLQYKSGTFKDLALQQNIILQGMRVSSDISLIQRSSENVSLQDFYFNEFSYFQWTILEKNYDRFKLADLLPFKLNTIGATVTTITQDYPYFVLPEAIQVPSTGSITLTFVPAAGVNTVAAAATNPQLPNLGLANDYGFSMPVVLMGSKNRPIS
jgi:hypothetical protein